MRASSTLKSMLVLALACTGLAGCGGDMDELDAYINQIKARPGGRIEPLPEITPYEVFTYVADREGLRSPFVPDTAQASSATRAMTPAGSSSASAVTAPGPASMKCR